MDIKQPKPVVYSVAIITKLLLLTGCIAAFALFFYLAFIAATDPGNEASSPVFIPAGIAVGIFILYACVSIIKEKLIVESSYFIHVTTFSKKQLFFAEVKGFRQNSKFITIEALPEKSSIKVSDHYGHKQQLLNFLNSNFINLDAEEQYEEHRKLLANTDYGYLEQDIQDKLTRTRRICKWTNIIVTVLCLWVIFYPYPYIAAMLFALITPLAVIGIVKLSRGFIKLDEQKNAASPNLTGSFIMPLLALALRVLLDFDIHQFNNIWVISAAVFIVIIGILLSGGVEFNFSTKNHRGSSIALIAFIYVYAISACVAVNCMFDNSPPQKYRVTVSQKRTEFNKSMNYYLTISPWGPVKESSEESVLKEVYDSVKPGDQVVVYYRKGLLSASWYHIR